MMDLLEIIELSWIFNYNEYKLLNLGLIFRQLNSNFLIIIMFTHSLILFLSNRCIPTKIMQLEEK